MSDASPAAAEPQSAAAQHRATPTLLSPRILIPFAIVTLIWGSTWIVIRDQLGVVPATWSVTYRFALAAVAMFVLVLFRRDPLWLPPRVMLFAAGVGMAQFCLNFNFVYRAEAYVTSGVVAVIFALLMVPNTLLSRLILKTRLKTRFLVGGGISTIGIILLLLHEARALTGDGSSVALGTALTLCALMCASTANVMQASAMGRSTPVYSVLAWAMLWGSVADALFAYATVGPPLIDLRWGYIGGIAYLGLLGTVVTFPLYVGLIRDIGAGPAAWTGVMIPIIAMALSTLLEGYDWSVLAMAGAAIAIIGLVWAVRPEPEPEIEPA